MQEIWKDIKEYVGLYQVSNLGRFKSLPRNTKNQYKYKERILKLSEDKDGYLLVNLNGKTFRSHVIVAQTFIKNDDDKPQINHIDGNKKNNNPENLLRCADTKSHRKIHAQLEKIAYQLIQEGFIIFDKNKQEYIANSNRRLI